MRYFIVQYVRRPNGQMDESITVSNRLTNRDLQTSAVIADFRDQKIIKASLQGNTVPKNFDRIVGFYHGHYKATIDRLLKENNLEVQHSAPASSATVTQNPG